MRVRTLFVSLGVAALAAVPLAGVAVAQPPGDRDCRDFSSQQEAQDALDSQVGDPERLDDDNDGRACDNFDYGSPAPAPRPAPAPEPSPRPEPGPAPAPDDRDDDADDDTAAPAPSAPPTSDGQIPVVPRGGVDTGDGTADAPAPLIGVVVALGAVAAAARRRAQSAG